jgi:hypothetical protein
MRVRAKNKAAENLHDEDDDDMCALCGNTPCNWIIYGEEAVQDIEKEYSSELDTKDNQMLHHSTYKLFVYSKYRFLVKGNGIKMAICVVDCRRQKWPDPNGEYTGYHSA